MNGSLYHLLVSQHPEQVIPMRCRPPIFARLVRYFEDLVVENNLAALVVQGRCLDGAPGAELQRFDRLSSAARYHYVFTCDAECRERTWSVPEAADTRAFEQRDHHLFDTGPFIIVTDPRFTGLLASRGVRDRDSGAAYEMLWSFEPNVVYTALEYLRARVAAQHRGHEAEFARRLGERAPSSTSLRLTLNLTTKLALLLQRQTELETAVSRISSLINSTFDLEEVCQRVVDQLSTSLAARRVVLAVWSERDLVPEMVREATGPSGPRAPAAGEPPPPIEVPVVSRGTAVGLLTVEDDSPVRIWEEEEVVMVRTVADHLAMGITNARLFRRVEEQAITDELTGLFNRRYFFERIEREMQLARQGGRAVSLLLFDLDHLKRINDTHGHSAGDAVIRAVGRRVKAVVRGVDVCARYGGEEFAVILPNTDRLGAMLAADCVRRALAAEPVGAVGEVTASFGVATYPGSATTSAELVDEADRAMYEAKRGGRNRVAFAGDLLEPGRAAGG